MAGPPRPSRAAALSAPVPLPALAAFSRSAARPARTPRVQEAARTPRERAGLSPASAPEEPTRARPGRAEVRATSLDRARMCAAESSVLPEASPLSRLLLLLRPSPGPDSLRALWPRRAPRSPGIQLMDLHPDWKLGCHRLEVGSRRSWPWVAVQGSNRPWGRARPPAG